MSIDYLNGLIKRLNTRGAELWTTRDEIAFIVGLGTHRNGEVYEPLVSQGLIPNFNEYQYRQSLLRQYLKASQNRQVWGDVDRMTCIEMAASLLAPIKENTNDDRSIDM